MSYGDPGPNFSAGTHYKVLSVFKGVAPYLVPPHPFRGFCLWRPDLDCQNILIGRDSSQISGFLDWQSAMTAPVWWQAEFPPCFKHSGSAVELPQPREECRLPQDCDKVSQEEKRKVTQDMRASRHATYADLLSDIPVVYGVLANSHPTRAVVPSPLCIATPIRRMNLGQCQEYLITLYAVWEDQVSAMPGFPQECPLTSWLQELVVWGVHVSEWHEIYEMHRQIEERLDVAIDGHTTIETYEQVRAEAKALRDEMLRNAVDEKKSRILGRWPYPDL